MLKELKLMITKDGRDTRIENLTPENYIVPAGEEKVYHAVIEVEQYDPRTGKKLSKPRVQKFGKKMYDSLVRDVLSQQGWTIKILHDPTEWLAAQREKAAKLAEQSKVDRDKAFADAVAAEVAKQMAEQKRKSKKEK